MNIALITAGGCGTRMKQDIPKQFINVNDKPVIIYTLEAFQKHPDIDAIIIACLSGWHEIMKAYIKQYHITKLKWIVEGGENGQQSIFNCLKKLKEECSREDIVVIHDGNRPLVSGEVISDCIVKCHLYGSGVACIPCTEATLETNDRNSSIKSISRDILVRTQTPHAFTLEKLLWAHEEAKKRNIKNTVATCTLMIELGEEIYLSAGSEKNFKITTMSDIEIFKALINYKRARWLE